MRPIRGIDRHPLYIYFQYMAPFQSNSLLPLGPFKYVRIVNLTIKYSRHNHGVGCQSKDPMLHMTCKLEKLLEFYYTISFGYLGHMNFCLLDFHF